MLIGRKALEFRKRLLPGSLETVQQGLSLYVQIGVATVVSGSLEVD